jgi:hypothetical protein
MENDSHLYILWTSGDPLTAMNMVMMYGGNSLRKGWWEKVTIIIWGAATHLVSSNAEVQKKIKELMGIGVFFTACKSCAKNLDAVDQLEALGIEVKFWGEPLSDLLKSGAKLLTI